MKDNKNIFDMLNGIFCSVLTLCLQCNNERIMVQTGRQ